MAYDISPEVKKKALGIKAIVCDVDGVLTDGGIIYDDTGLEYKRFHVRDGLGLKLLQRAGLLGGVITGRNSEVVRYRCKELGFDFHHHGIKDKWKFFFSSLSAEGITPEEAAFIGDDLVDLPILKQCGLAIVPSDAPAYIRQHADYVTSVPGGGGVLREAVDMLLQAQDKMDRLMEEYLSSLT